MRNAIPAIERNTSDPQTPEQVNPFALTMFMEFLAMESHQNFMQIYPTLANTSVDEEELHVLLLYLQARSK